MFGRTSISGTVLFFIDGHADFYSPEAEPNGEVASMDLTVVTGQDPAVLADVLNDDVMRGAAEASSLHQPPSPLVTEGCHP